MRATARFATDECTHLKTLGERAVPSQVGRQPRGRLHVVAVSVLGGNAATATPRAATTTPRPAQPQFPYPRGFLRALSSIRMQARASLHVPLRPTTVDCGPRPSITRRSVHPRADGSHAGNAWQR
jgi:hypothetical protein